MIALDTNILVHSFRESSPFHARALACVTGLANGRQPWALPWPCVHEFLAVATNTKIPPKPKSPARAIAAVDAWLASPSVTVISEAGEHWQQLTALMTNGHVMGGMVHDARIAALCLQHGVRELWTADRDFSRFTALRVFNPLLS